MDEFEVVTINDGSSGGGGSSSSSWWENTLQFVIQSAANAKYNQPKIGANQQYIMTADGRLVPAGYASGTVVNPQASAIPSWAILAFVGLGAVLLLKAAK